MTKDIEQALKEEEKTQYGIHLFQLNNTNLFKRKG